MLGLERIRMPAPTPAAAVVEACEPRELGCYPQAQAVEPAVGLLLLLPAEQVLQLQRLARLTSALSLHRLAAPVVGLPVELLLAPRRSCWYGQDIVPAFQQELAQEWHRALLATREQHLQCCWLSWMRLAATPRGRLHS